MPEFHGPIRSKYEFFRKYFIEYLFNIKNIINFALKQVYSFCFIGMKNQNDNNSVNLKTKLTGLRASLFKDGDGEVWLYGSRARGDNKSDSDWDLLVIVNKSLSFREAYDNFAYPFVELGWDYNQAIVPVIYTRNEWENEKNSMFYNNVIKDRIRI